MSAIDRMGRPLRDGPFRGNVRVVAMTAVDPYGLQTIDGVALKQGDRVLVASQDLPEDNGIYIASSAAWSRSRDLSSSDDFFGPIIVSVEDGDVYRNEIFWSKIATDTVVGTTPVIWNQGLGGLANQRRGMWNPLIDYAVGDLVTWQNIEYIALVRNTDEEPPNQAVWDVTHDPFAGKPTFAPSTSDLAALNLVNGVAPSAPVEGDMWATGNELFWHISGFTIKFQSNNVKYTTPASTTARASLNIDNGTAPTTPVNGDIWASGNQLTWYIGSTSVGIQTKNIKYETPASSTSRASLNIGNGTAPTTPVDGDIWGVSNGLHRYIGGALTRILTNNDFTSFPSGSQIGAQEVASFTSATITGAGNTASFDTDPFLVSEGTEIASFSYACKRASGSRLVIEAQVPLGATTTGYAIFGIFRGSTNVGVAYAEIYNGKTDTFTFKGSVAAHPGNTTSATYSLRAAVAVSANSYIVNNSSSTLFGGNQVGVVFSLREVTT